VSSLSSLGFEALQALENETCNIASRRKKHNRRKTWESQAVHQCIQTPFIQSLSL